MIDRSTREYQLGAYIDQDIEPVVGLFNLLHRRGPFLLVDHVQVNVRMVPLWIDFLQFLHDLFTQSFLGLQVGNDDGRAL